MYSSPLDMIDEWDDQIIDTGKSYSKTDFSSYKNKAEEDKGTDDDSGWNDSSENHAYNSTVNDRGNCFGGGRGGGGGRVVRGGRGGGGGDRGRRDGGNSGGYRGNRDINENDDNRGSNRYSQNNGYRNRDNDEGDDIIGEFGGRGRGRGGGRGRGRGGGRPGGGGGGCGADNEDGDNNGDNFQEEKPREFYIPPEPSNDEKDIFGTGIGSGINFGKYDNIPVKATGDNPPPPINTFESSGLKQFLLDIIIKSGYTKPTPIQKSAIPIVLAKRDLMACAQTGSGKTAAFLLPIINDLLENERDLNIGKPHVVIVSPTRELSIQIYNEARKFTYGSNLQTVIIYGGTASRSQNSNISRGCHILVCTPGRLLDFVDKEYVSFKDVRYVVLDEADRMLDMGFRDDMTKMISHRTMPSMKDRRTLMFSATFPADVQDLAGQFLNNYIFVAVGIVGGACADVQQIIHKVRKFDKRKKLLEILQKDDPSGTMIFVEKKFQADFLASFLSEDSLPTTSMHGDRLQRQREEALAAFKQNKMKILVGTSVMARGLDIKNVSHVINFDLPNNIDEYVHRIGRTGRLGNQGKSTSFYDPELDSALAPDLVKILKQADQLVPEFLLSGGVSVNNGDNSGNRNSFGGRDIRNNNNKLDSFEPEAVQPHEPEEEW